MECACRPWLTLSEIRLTGSSPSTTSAATAGPGNVLRFGTKWPKYRNPEFLPSLQFWFCTELTILSAYVVQFSCQKGFIRKFLVKEALSLRLRRPFQSIMILNVLFSTKLPNYEISKFLIEKPLDRIKSVEQTRWLKRKTKQLTNVLRKTYPSATNHFINIFNTFAVIMTSAVPLCKFPRLP